MAFTNYDLAVCQRENASLGRCLVSTISSIEGPSISAWQCCGGTSNRASKPEAKAAELV